MKKEESGKTKNAGSKEDTRSNHFDWLLFLFLAIVIALLVAVISK